MWHRHCSREKCGFWKVPHTHALHIYVKTSDLCNLRVEKKLWSLTLKCRHEARINAILAKYVTIQLVSPGVSSTQLWLLKTGISEIRTNLAGAWMAHLPEAPLEPKPAQFRWTWKQVRFIYWMVRLKRLERIQIMLDVPPHQVLQSSHQPLPEPSETTPLLRPLPFLQEIYHEATELSLCASTQTSISCAEWGMAHSPLTGLQTQHKFWSRHLSAHQSTH